jgi:hypothetical protein
MAQATLVIGTCKFKLAPRLQGLSLLVGYRLAASTTLLSERCSEDADSEYQALLGSWGCRPVATPPDYADVLPTFQGKPQRLCYQSQAKLMPPD